MRKACIGLLLASLAAVACEKAATTQQRVQRHIYNMVVPDHAAATDSIRISFFDDTGFCDSAPQVDAHEANDTLRIAVSSIPNDDGCIRDGFAPGVIVQRPYVYYSQPPHAHNLTVLFAEPGAADSVRSVIIQ